MNIRGSTWSAFEHTVVRRLGVFVEDHGLGTVTGADGVYDFENTGQRDTGLIPDVGFFHAFRRPLVENDRPIPFAPDLAAEVVSPTQSAGDMAAKAQRYLAGGTSLVWMVWPARQTIDVWHPADDTPSAIPGIGDLLSGEDVVPSFNYLVAALLAV